MGVGYMDEKRIVIVVFISLVIPCFAGIMGEDVSGRSIPSPDYEGGWVSEGGISPQVNTWTNMSPGNSPPATYYHAMAYDSKNNKTVMFGGYSSGQYTRETYAYDYGTNSWTLLSISSKPVQMDTVAMVYDSQSSLMVLVGATAYYIYVYVFDYSTMKWTQKSTPGVQPRKGALLAYNSKVDRTILFGGEGYSDTWEYDVDGNKWTNKNPLSHPSMRKWSSMAYDSQSDRVILFGGLDTVTSKNYNDTWAYDYNNNTWTNLTPAVSPPPRNGHALVYDSGNDLIIMYGGYGDSGALDDTWTYDYETNTWTRMNPVTKPPALYWHSMAYDSKVNRTILFGGYIKGARAETWAYECDTSPVPPVVVSTQPQDKETNVSLDANIQIEFSEEMDRASAEGAFSINPQVKGNFTWDPYGKVMIFDPVSELKSKTLYQVTVNATARSKSGVNMASPYSFSFTTEYRPPVPTPPYVSRTKPLDGETNVPLNTTIQIEFSEEMDDKATTGAISSVPSITGSFQWDTSRKTLTWIPSANLLENQKYTIAISTLAKDAEGENLQNPYTFSFTTKQVSDMTPPRVIKTDPSNGKTNVDKNSNITITFSEPMDQSATESAISLTPGEIVSFSWDNTGSILSILPVLENDTTYECTVSTGATDLAGNPMVSDYTFTFSTKKSIDSTPPAVKSVTPQNNSKGVDPNLVVTITFTEPMNKASVESSIVISPEPGTYPSMTWDQTGTILKISLQLEPSRTYTITIKSSAKDLAGNPMRSNYVFTYTTRGAQKTEDSSGLIISAVIIIIVVAIFGAILFFTLKKKREAEARESMKRIPFAMERNYNPYARMPPQDSEAGYEEDQRFSE